MKVEIFSHADLARLNRIINQFFYDNPKITVQFIKQTEVPINKDDTSTTISIFYTEL